MKPVGPRREKPGREVGASEVPGLDITLREAPLGGVPSVPWLGDSLSHSKPCRGNFLPAPPSQQGLPRAPKRPSAGAHYPCPRSSDFPGNSASQAAWGPRPFTIVPVPGYHSWEAGPAWQQPHPYAGAPPTRCPGPPEAQAADLNWKHNPSSRTWPG